MMINHLIKEYCFTVCNLLLLQCIYIPIGIDPAPFLPNDYEADFISNISETGKPRAIKFKRTSCFIDDE